MTSHVSHMGHIMSCANTVVLQKKLINKFLVYEAEWNVVKMNYGKYELEILNIAFLIILPQLLILRIYP